MHCNYPSLVYQLLNVNWSTFLEGILLTPQNHDWKNGTIGGHRLPKIAPTAFGLLMWRRPLCGCHGFSRGALTKIFCHLPPHPTSPLVPPTPSVSSTDIKKRAKYHKIHPSVIWKVSYILLLNTHAQYQAKVEFL